jgi:hypothetical protein
MYGCDESGSLADWATGFLGSAAGEHEGIASLLASTSAKEKNFKLTVCVAGIL